MPSTTKRTRRKTPAQRKNSQKVISTKRQTCNSNKPRGRATERPQKTPAEPKKSTARVQAQSGRSPRGRGRGQKQQGGRRETSSITAKNHKKQAPKHQRQRFNS
ncbi:hypothetical protein EYF80_014482 [Liparis tanakae]|uniref:Uncharacterized protein n=1 Tax=Liparis tanakae TaxID=230148 RepID=A0A4Z2ICM7_9TELE|nr:hypothetical protein EYF80_014482 [Liparis tanakae]